jgi:alpha-galactosidase
VQWIAFPILFCGRPRSFWSELNKISFTYITVSVHNTHRKQEVAAAQHRDISCQESSRYKAVYQPVATATAIAAANKMASRLKVVRLTPEQSRRSTLAAPASVSTPILVMMVMMVMTMTSFLVNNNHNTGFVAVVEAYDNGLGRTPPMGWNTWNHFGCNIDEELVRDTATVMVDSGLHQVGYQYVNVDDCWQIGRDPTSFRIIADTKKFPSGIPVLVDYVHSLGLKFGLYSDSGLLTCQGRPGGLYFEQVDADTYTSWKVDYLKYDNCFARGQGAVQLRYQRMHDALNQTGVPLFFSMCEWGVEDPALWAGPIGNSWRTTQDIEANWDSIVLCLDENDKWHDQAGPGGFNDPDMLQVGNGDLTIPEQRAHFTLWCLVKAPLLLGNDLRNMTQDIMGIITNEEVIAWNQDPLGIQGYKRWSSSADNHQTDDHEVVTARGGGTRGATTKLDDSDGPVEVWAGDLSGGDVAVVLFNRSKKERIITAVFQDIGICSCCTKAVMVRDVWAHQDLGLHQMNISATVGSHDVVAFRLTPIKVLTNSMTTASHGDDCDCFQAQTKE